jgi:hypothetical protein
MKMPNVIRASIQSGAVTQSQDHAITPVSLSTMKMQNKINPIPLILNPPIEKCRQLLNLPALEVYLGYRLCQMLS